MGTGTLPNLEVLVWTFLLKCLWTANLLAEKCEATYGSAFVSSKYASLTNKRITPLN